MLCFSNFPSSDMLPKRSSSRRCTLWSAVSASTTPKTSAAGVRRWMGPPFKRTSSLFAITCLFRVLTNPPHDYPIQPRPSLPTPLPSRPWPSSYNTVPLLYWKDEFHESPILIRDGDSQEIVAPGPTALTLHHLIT